MEDKPRKCVLNEDHSVRLSDILVSFNAPISEEHAWALCYQCAKCFRNEFKSNRSKCRLVSQLDQILIHRDGHVHPNTIFAGGGDAASERDSSDAEQTEKDIVAGLGLVLFRALDFGIDDDEERDLSPELSRLIQNMTVPAGSEERQINETDDEGIERDAGESEEESHQPPRTSLSLVLQECTVHLGCGGTQEADTHYRAVCRALVAEALELSTFLENVGTRQMRQQQDPPDHLDKLNISDWARLWIQVIRELRMGVKLKKVCYTRKPIEYELTPYEILMDDIRSRRYKLNKVMVDGNIPHRVKKDAHAIILEFIRSRPPLRKASERKLKPAIVTSTPREKLLASIKQGDIHLTPIRRNSRREDTTDGLDSTSEIRQSKRIIKIDYSKLDTDDDDEELGVRTEDEDDEPRVETNADAEGKPTNGSNPWQRTGSLRLSKAEIDHYCDTALQRTPSNNKSRLSECCIL